MGVREVLSLVRGLGYSFGASTPTSGPESRMSSPAEVKRFFGAALRYAPGGD